jgi:AAHS family 4-hydroxybenzoate transporter-like MFS transporter
MTLRKSAGGAAHRPSQTAANRDTGLRPQLIIVIAVLFALQVTGGIDDTVLSFTAPFVRQELGIGFESLGAAFSAGYIGGALGAVLFGTLADSIGRKIALLFAALSFSIGCFCTIFVHTCSELIIVRLLTGLALGGLFPVIASSIFEIVPTRLRATAVTLTSVGSAVGLSLCGPLVAVVEPHFGWRGVFIIGAAIPAFLSILVKIFIPKPATSKKRSDTPYRAVRKPLDFFTSLFAAERWKITLLLWAAFIASAVPMFFALSWLPSLAHLAHISASIAPIGPSIFAVSGLIFSIILARVIDRMGNPFLPLAASTALGAPAFILLGQSFGNDHAFLIACGLAGALSLSSVTLIGVLAGVLYEDDFRARGIGWAVATMRFGSALAPWLGGRLIDAAMPVQMMFLGLAVSPLMSGLGILALWQMANRQKLKAPVVSGRNPISGYTARNEE